MTEKKIETNEHLLNKVSQKCKFFYRLFLVILIVSTLVWVVMMVVAGIAYLGLIGDGSPSFSLLDLVPLVSIGVLYLALLFTIVHILKDVTCGMSPFAQVQVRRMKFLAVLVLAYGVLEAVLSTMFSGVIIMDDVVNLGFVSSAENSRTDPLVSINVGVFIVAAVIFCLASVFEYGVELQKQTDEVL